MRGAGRGAMPHPRIFFKIFYLKRRVLVDSDVLNLLVTLTRV